MKMVVETELKDTDIGRIPKSWEVKTLGECIESIIDHRGLTPHKLGGEWSEVGYRAISARNIKDGRLIAEDSVNFVDEELYKRWMPDEVRENDILLTSEAPLGECLLWKTNEKIVLSQRVFGIRAASSAMDPEFLFWFMKSRTFQNELSYRETGTTVQGIRQSELRLARVAVPPLSEQRAIAKVLSDLDSKIELNQQMNRTLEAIARALFKHWFIDFGFPNEDGKPYRSSGGEMVYIEEFGEEVPGGWQVGTLADLADLSPETWSEATAPAEICYVDLSSTKWGVIEQTQTYRWKDAPSRAQRVLRPGDTIIGTVRPGNGSYSRIAEEGLTGSTGFAVLRPRRPGSEDYVYLAATSRENIERLAHLADGAAYPAVRPDVVLATQIVLPPGALMERFAGVARSILAKIASNLEESLTLGQLRDYLLPRLMSGKIRVPVEVR